MNHKLKEKILESVSAVLPITGIVLLLSILLVPVDLGIMVMFLVGAILLVIGMGFFQLGAEMSMTPLGEGIGVQISKTRHIPLIFLTGFSMGAIITISEPDLQVLAEQVPAVPNLTLILTVAVGVGIFLAVAILRILFQINLSTILIILYITLTGISFLVSRDFLAVAFDSGGVTTGPMTVPFIMAMGVGLASVRGDKNASSDSFGLVALSSVGPILAVLILGMFFSPGETAYSASSVAAVSTTRDVVKEFLFNMPSYIKEVLISLIPVAAVFALFQRLSRRYPRRQVKRITVGFAYTYLGLVLFLCGVNVGFAPLGSLLGNEIASEVWRWLLVPIGMLIGYYIVKAEPAIQVLNRQVEGVTNGSVSAKSMNRCMSWGVSASVGLSMIRVLTGVPVQWIIIPGYLIALLLSRFVPKMFVGIAFDSGGVASGPMTTTFLLPLSIGACEAVGGNLMTDAFGVVALVALTPLIAIQLMGILYRYKLKTTEKAAVREAEILAMDGVDDIFEFQEGEEDGGQL
ncbi:DUF1538 domain-containing protein [Acetatifactor aquisgranensis]|uniref:DUF1538 domain-containing protein n=1 Tax=Acetatifactor aquisgranensis TaxID=2941233 RepID=UPI00203D120E|nr:DUF1538 domain-containing protein [Acetatifactor aquisgranensis]MCI8543996.1 DUF1538 domain-containing protein [Lachnospiraceae bacterium]